MWMSLSTPSAPRAQAENSLKTAISTQKTVEPKVRVAELIVTVEQPRYRKGDWQAVSIQPAVADNVQISSINGVTPIPLTRFTRVKVKGHVQTWGGKYQLKFFECEPVPIEYRNPVRTILARNGVPKVRAEFLESELGDDFARKIVHDPALIRKLFHKIKEPGTKAIECSCVAAIAGNEIFQALNAVGAPQATIDAAAAFDLEKQDVYDLIERGCRSSEPMISPSIPISKPYSLSILTAPRVLHMRR
jgi:hypothetical protein